MEYIPEDDGTAMVAISSKGRTKLGRLLAAGASIPVVFEDRGKFASLAAFIRYLNGDRREQVRAERGPNYDEVLNESVHEVYHDLLQDYVRAMFRSPHAQQMNLRELLRTNRLPLAVYQDVEDELIPMELPLWYSEILYSERDRAEDTAMAWSDKEIATPRARSLSELQHAYLEITQGTDTVVDFVVSQEEYESIPPAVRKMMGDALKIQASTEGRFIKPPTRE